MEIFERLRGSWLILSVVYIRTASFMMRFRASENRVCNLFAAQAARTLSDVNDRYGNSSESNNSLKDAVQDNLTDKKHCHSMFAISHTS